MNGYNLKDMGINLLNGNFKNIGLNPSLIIKKIPLAQMKNHDLLFQDLLAN